MSNKITYKQLIDMLKEHQHIANDQWEVISNELYFSRQFNDLPKHKVEKDLWSGIELALETDPGLTVRQHKSYFRFLPIAILIFSVFIFMSVYFLKMSSVQEFVYSSEVESHTSSFEVPTNDPDSYEMATQFIENNKFLFSEENIGEYYTELKALDEAIEEIKIIQESYGIDESMIKLLSKMEREKATLIKSMINRT